MFIIFGEAILGTRLVQTSNHFLMNLSREAPSRRSAGFAQNTAAEPEAAAPASEP